MKINNDDDVGVHADPSLRLPLGMQANMYPRNIEKN